MDYRSIEGINMAIEAVMGQEKGVGGIEGNHGLFEWIYESYWGFEDIIRVFKQLWEQ